MGNRKRTVIVIVVLALLVLSGIVYFMLTKEDKETTLNMNISDLSLTFLIRTLNNWIKKLSFWKIRARTIGLSGTPSSQARPEHMADGRKTAA